MENITQSKVYAILYILFCSDSRHDWSKGDESKWFFCSTAILRKVSTQGTAYNALEEYTITPTNRTYSKEKGITKMYALKVGAREKMLEVLKKAATAGMKMTLPKLKYEDLDKTPIHLPTEEEIRDANLTNYEFFYMKLLLAQLDENNKLTTYYLKSKSGRKFAVGVSIQGASKKLRSILIKDATMIDQRKACPIIMCDYVRKNTTNPEILAYNDMIEAKIRDNQISKDDLLPATFGGSTPSQELKKWQELRDIVVREAASSLVSNLSHEEYRSYLAQLVFTKESQIQARLEQILSEMGYQRISHIFDGCIIQGKINPDDLIKANEMIRAEFDIPAFLSKIEKEF